MRNQNKEPSRNNHHVLHFKTDWLRRTDGQRLRENPSLIARQVFTVGHRTLHANAEAVPVPSYHTLHFVAERLPADLDVITGIDRFCSLIEASNRHPKAGLIEKRLSELTIEASRLQIPWIVDMLPNEQRRYFV